MHALKSIIFAGLLALSGAAQAGYVFVGSWNVNSGPSWFPPGSQPILTGRQAAALLFGGSPTDYAISTTGSDENLINFSAWVSSYGQGHSGDIVGQDFFQDSGAIGVYDTQGDTSAYIQDWCYQGNCINYAFKVPEPGALALLGGGMLLLLGFRLRNSYWSSSAAVR